MSHGKIRKYSQKLIKRIYSFLVIFFYYNKYSYMFFKIYIYILPDGF